MKWTENLVSYAKNGEKGNCPFCGSKDIEVKETLYGRGSITFSCKKCGEMCHIDGRNKKSK